MPKMKTHSGAKKRVRKLGDGKTLKRGRAYRSHHAWAKTTKQKRNLRGMVAFGAAGEQEKMQRLLPY